MKRNRSSVNVKLRDKLLADNQGGLLFFLKRHPEFWFQMRYKQPIEVDSPFDSRKSRMTLYYSEDNQKWFFKDHGSNGYYGDMFSYVAFLNGLDFTRDFHRILALIQTEMAGYKPPFFDTYKLMNNETGEWISFFR